MKLQSIPRVVSTLCVLFFLAANFTYTQDVDLMITGMGF